MNKRAQLAIIFVFIVALVLIVSALIAFYYFEGDFPSVSREYSRTITHVEFSQRFIVSEMETIVINALNCSSCEGDLKERIRTTSIEHDKGIYQFGNFFGLLRTGKFEIEETSEGYKLKIEDLFAHSSFGKSEKNAGNYIKRNFDLEMVFDKGGKTISRNISFTQDL